MDFFSVLTLIGGLAMFLFGMNTMGEALVKVSGGRLDSILEKLTSSRLKAVLLGAAVTAVIQSSSATTVMVIGFVNSGIMDLTHAAGVIMGANIGTTVTSWLLSLAGVSGSSFWVSLFKPSSFSPILAGIGIVLTMTAKENRCKRDIGSVLLGFAVLMFGMQTMSGAVEPLAENPQFTAILTVFSNPILGVLAGTLLTAVLQSSSASVGILQALCLTGAVSYGTAIPIIMGQNIGTCVTALLSGIGARRDARRASMMHLYFNLIGTVVFMAVFYLLDAFLDFAFLDEAASAVGVAAVHSLFNIGCCVAWFPFANVLVRLAVLTVPDRRGAATRESYPGELAVLDDRFLEKPEYAVKISKDTAVRMALRVQDALDAGIALLDGYSEEAAGEVAAIEQQTAAYSAALSEYLMKISGSELSVESSRQVSMMLQCTRDFERMAAHISAVREATRLLREREMRISDSGLRELSVYVGATREIFEHTVRAFRTADLQTARSIEAYGKAVDGMSVELRQRHVDRLRRGKCSMEAGLILEDILTAFDHIRDNCVHVGNCITRVYGEGAAEAEEAEIPGFWEDYRRMKEKYVLPERLKPERDEEHKKKEKGKHKGKDGGKKEKKDKKQP
ncbi:MAG: Na/Pi cotransporter family protein [Firmicutes bacterium]|nr:Na/Pi cotransporter family protein [Bacillota bacterium]